MRNPGTLIQLSDGRRVIAYKKQPLKSVGFSVFNLVNEDLKPVLDENNRPARLIKGEKVIKEFLTGAKIIGMVD